MKKLLLVIVSFWAFAASAAPLSQALDNIPVQDGGRIKPFSTFARESLQLIYGKSTFEKKAASEVLFTWMLIPEHWMATPLIEVRHAGVREALKITDGKDVTRFTPEKLLTNERIALVMQELNTARSRQEKLNPYFQAVQRLENQLGLFQAVRNGAALRVVPDPGSDTWKSVAELGDEPKEAFAQLTKAFIDAIANAGKDKAPSVTPELLAARDNFIEKARAAAPEKYADMKRIGWEIHLNDFHPFMWAWISYLIALVLLIASEMSGSNRADQVGRFALIAAFFLQTYGMALRVYLTGRPPVSNMYETVVWVSWGALVFSWILDRYQKNKLLLMAASVVGIFCLILTDLAPTVLDKSIQPLEPVLRSTFWLTTHVLIITISYAAFFLAFAIGDVLLFYYLKDENRYASQIQAGVQSIYRCIQIGVVLLAFGIILGGIWADYSWGRFWGWDPKETWALISLLGYIALLHGRLIGWVKNFEMVLGAIIAFSLVIMAWYGVNFVLGAGLHTYGFGAGGVEYVTGFVVMHVLYVTYVSTVRYGRIKK